MKKNILTCFIFLVLFVNSAYSVELLDTNENFSNQDILSWMIKIEASQKAILIEMRTRSEALIREMTQGFEAVDKRFEDMYKYIDDRFEDLDKRFKEIDKRFEEIDKRFTAFKEQIAQIRTFFYAVLAAFVTMFSVIIGFALWDRRTNLTQAKEVAIKAVEESKKEISNNQSETYILVKKVVEVMKKMTEKDPEMRGYMQTANLL